jgi:hypothetical protein
MTEINSNTSSSGDHFRLNGGNGLQRYRYKAQYDQQKQKRVQSASGDFMFG